MNLAQCQSIFYHWVPIRLAIRDNFKTMKRENPGFIFGLFLTTLLGARIAIEITKTQQAAFGLPFGLTMGQILSIPATAIGIWLLVRSAKRLSLVLWVSK